MNPAAREFPLFTINGLKISATPSAIIGSLVLWVILTIVALVFTELSLIVSVVAGFLTMLLHWAFEIIHQMGHASAARKAGYPMLGVRLYLVLGASLYPADELDLPAQIHIQRALGGPKISLMVLAIATAILLLVWSAAGDFVRMLALFALLDNLLVFTIGAVVPFPFPNLIENDGVTLMRWRGK
ncbi:hypothetical protein ANRL2_02139 [Anaerolineae bacterium]|nr:hypothetical protein ANRL2_02139 [Anaerolineae bacterium]